MQAPSRTKVLVRPISFPSSQKQNPSCEALLEKFIEDNCHTPQFLQINIANIFSIKQSRGKFFCEVQLQDRALKIQCTDTSGQITLVDKLTYQEQILPHWTLGQIQKKLLDAYVKHNQYQKQIIIQYFSDLDHVNLTGIYYPRVLFVNNKMVVSTPAVAHMDQFDEEDDLSFSDNEIDTLSSNKATYATVVSDETKQFHRDVSTLLNIFASTVSDIISKSYTQAIVNNIDKSIRTKYGTTIKNIRHETKRDVPMRIQKCIETASGNCDEMALMGKGLIDLYLYDMLKKMGYAHVNVRAEILRADKESMSDHVIVLARFTLNGEAHKYMIDSWNKEKVFTSLDGMTYFHDPSNQNKYVRPGIKFYIFTQKNDVLNNPQNRQQLKCIFEKPLVQEMNDTGHFKLSTYAYLMKRIEVAFPEIGSSF